MERDDFFTIKHSSQVELVVEKSRFIAYSKNIRNGSQAKIFIKQITHLHPHASHRAYAYVIGPKDQIKRFSDDGEPQKSAGASILKVIQKNVLHDTLVIVVRYFSGIKLGYKNLVQTYIKITEAVLKKSEAIPIPVNMLKRKYLAKEMGEKKRKDLAEPKYTLLSFIPKYADLILKGKKTVDYRKHIFNRNYAKRVYMYSSMPIQRVVGYFTVKEILKGTPEEIWKLTYNKGGMTKKAFFDHFYECPLAYAIVIGKVRQFNPPKTLAEFDRSSRPPISFRYIRVKLKEF